MRLEVAQSLDAAAMAVAHVASFEQPWSAAQIAELQQGPGAFGFLVREEPRGAVLAFILARAVAGEAEILTLAVDPARRRMGIGRALVEAAGSAAAAAGARTLFLEVAEDNRAALALYQRAGFEPAGRRAAYYRRAGGAVDALVLRRDLNRPAA